MLGVLIISVLLVVIIWRAYYAEKWAHKLKVSLKFLDESVYAKDETKLIEVIENRKRLPVTVLEVGFHAKKELKFFDTDNTNVSDYIYKRDIFSVLGWQKITREIHVLCMKRGYYEIQEVDLTSFSTLFDKRYGKTMEMDASVFVYPAKTNVKDIMVICESLCGNVQCRKHLYEDPFAFRSIREYTINDSMKTINWKASARTNELMVNTYDSAMTQKIMIFLDLEDSGILKHEDVIEESISIVTSVANKMIRQGMEVGFISNAFDSKQKRENLYLPIRNGRQQMIALERMLALYQESDGCCPFHELLSQFEQKNKDKKDIVDTVCLFISKNFKEENLQAMLRILGNEGLGLWVCPIEQEEINKKREPKLQHAQLRFLVRGVERS